MEGKRGGWKVEDLFNYYMYDTVYVVIIMTRRGWVFLL